MSMSANAPDAPTLSWSTGRNRTTATWTQVHDKSWSSFVEWLCPEKPAASKEVRPYVGGTLQHGRRTIRTVEQRFFLTLDADYADVDFPFDVADLLGNVPYLIHTTWRHTAEAHRYRLIIPLSRGIMPNEYKELAWTVMNRLDGKRFDVTTAQAERFMWSPSTADPNLYFQVSANARGPYLPADVWLDGHHGPSEAPAATGQGNPPPAPPATGSGPLTASAEDKERAEEILAQACDAVEHVYERDEFAGRNAAVFHLMPLLFRFCKAGALDEDTVKEALWESAQKVQADEPYERTEFDASVRSARQYADETGPELPATTATRLAQADFADVDPDDGIDIDIDIWDKTPILQHVWQAAASMGRNPFALLAVTLARVLAEVHPDVCLPGVEDGAIGDRAALNLGVALVGSSGQGKSSYIRNSVKLLLEGRDQKPITGKPSTGQGLMQEYLKWNEALGENELIPEPRRIFIVDEIDTLGQLGGDSGSTLFSEMRIMLTGGTSGSSNATAIRRRKLFEGTYNFQIVVGVQPTRAGALLNSSDAGTPQRFIWASVTDPKTALRPEDRPEWPGSLDWQKDFLLHFEFGDPIVRYPDWLVKELLDYDYKISLENEGGGELSQHGHHNLLRLKVATAIAFLHQEVAITDLHVEIADKILIASKRSQSVCEKAVAQATFDRKKAAKQTDERVNDEVGQEKLTRLVKRARDTLLRSKGEWVRGHELRPPVLHDRDEYGEAVWDAIAAMEDVDVEEVKHGEQIRRKARVKDDTP